jgi:hypothetical protein
MARPRRNRRRRLPPVDLLLDSVSYIDTVAVILPRSMPKEQFAELRGSLVSTQRSVHRRYVVKKIPHPDGAWHLVMFVHQPTRRALEILDDAMRPPLRARLHEVHLALDLCTRTAVDARRLQEYVVELWLPSRRPKAPVQWIHGTAYYNRGTRRGVESVLYADLPSKVSSTHCLHIENRIVGSARLRTAGLATAQGLIGLDHAAYWENALVLRRSPSEFGLARRLAQVRSRQAADLNVHPYPPARSASLLLRRSLGPHGAVVAYDVLAEMRRYKSLYAGRPGLLFTKQRHDWLLPRPGNALW